MEVKQSYKGLFTSKNNEYSPSFWRNTPKERGLLDQHKLLSMDRIVKDMIPREDITDLMYYSDAMYFTYKGVQYKTNDVNYDMESHKHNWTECSYNVVKASDLTNVTNEGLYICFDYLGERYKYKGNVYRELSTVAQLVGSWEKI